MVRGERRNVISSGGDWGLLNQGEFVRRGDRGGDAGAGGGQEGLQNKDPGLDEVSWLNRRGSP